MTRRLRVSVDARPLDIPVLRAQGIGRYAQGLLGPLADVAAERGAELVLLHGNRTRQPAFGDRLPSRASGLRLRRPPVPPGLADWPEHALLPLDIRRARACVHHSLSIYRSPLRAGVPAVTTIHDLIPLMWPQLYLRRGATHRLLYRAARHARLLLAVSETTRRDVIALLDVPADRVVHVPEAAGERFRPADPAPAQRRLGFDDPYLLYVGGLASPDPRKNVDGLVRAFIEWRAREARPERLVLAGQTGPATEALRAGADAGSVAFPGFVSDDELPALLSGARALVTASRYEGFGLPALEAISCGTPVVCFDIGAIPEVAGPGCLTAPDGDLTALLRAAGRVCDEHELASRLSSQGLRHSQHFSWRRTAELTFDAYERAAGWGSQGTGSSP